MKQLTQQKVYGYEELYGYLTSLAHGVSTFYIPVKPSTQTP